MKLTKKIRTFYGTTLLAVALINLFCTHTLYCNDKENIEFTIFSYIEIEDLKKIPQDISIIDRVKLDNVNNRLSIKANYINNYFKPWKAHEIKEQKSRNNFSKEYKSNYINHKYYDETTREYTLVTMIDILHNINEDNYGNISKYGIVTKNTNLRGLPTEKPTFEVSWKARGGYPFDDGQLDMLYIGNPIFILHFSLDKRFAYVHTQDLYGWIRTSDIAILTSNETKKWKNHEFATIKTDKTPLINERGNLIEMALLGTNLPIISIKQDHVIVAVPSQNVNNEFGFEKVKLSKNNCVIETQKFTADNIKYITNQLLGQNYGWGNYLENRDCASMVRDFFSTFHIWMPRDSDLQEAFFKHKILELSDKTPEQKLEIVTKQGKPFKTLFFYEGHVGIYAGTYNNIPIIFHSIWGNKTLDGDKEGRNIIGKAVFSSLEWGKELKFIPKNNGPINKLLSMAIIED